MDTPKNNQNNPNNQTKKPFELDEKGRRRTLAPTVLVQYLGQDSCDRFLRFYLYKGETETLVKRLEKVGLTLQRALQPFGPLMAELGDRVESGVVKQLREQGYSVFDLKEQDETATVRALRSVQNKPVYLYQAKVKGKLGSWPFEGQADLIRAERDSESGQLRLLVGDVKSTRQDKVQHRLQVSIYVKLLHQMLMPQGERALFEGTVVRREADGTLQNPDGALKFDLQPYFAALERLVTDLERVDTTELPELHYYVNHKCDGCLFNPVCLVESAERQDLALVPFMESADKRALVEQGIKTVADLASLKQLPIVPDKAERERQQLETGRKLDMSLKPSPGQENRVAALSEKWPVGPKLDRLVQRARRVWRYFTQDDSVQSYGYLLDGGRSTLPADEAYPDLIKIFLDVQTDYMEDRVYLAGALVSGPKGSQSVVKITPGVTNAERERGLLTEWVTEILQAVFKVAENAEAAPVHLYLYNRHDQRHLLEALRRHLDVFASLPAMYELLTETPALTQAAVSFIYDEVKERRNFMRAGHTLQSVAFQLGFKWDDGAHALYYRLFERGMFDYLLERKSDGLTVESAARFFSNIPLEYAYAAWGMFRAEDFKPMQRRDVTPYLRVTTAQIVNFQAKRLEALAYIESKLRPKNAYIKKEPLNLNALATASAQPVPFRKVLEEFLYIEHYANLQEHLQLFTQPNVKRVQMGRSLLLRCTSIEEKVFRNKKAYTAHFEADFSQTGIEPTAAMQINKLKPDSWCVLNELEKDGQAWDMVRGRLAIIQSQDGMQVSLDLSEMSFAAPKNQPKPTIAFRYYHNNKLLPVPGQYYMLDEMVDDLNGDKLLEACRQAEHNSFYHLLSVAALSGELNRRQNLAPELPAKAREFAELVASIEGQFAPTAAQQAVIAGHFARKVFLVQGPPGTGKSHTLGWAALARMYAEQATGGTLRIAVSCQTHNAVNIVLQSIANKLKKLQGTPAGDLLQDLAIYKIGDESNSDQLPEGVAMLDTWVSRGQIARILSSKLVVIGATPGGLYKLMKQSSYNAPDSFWQQKPFDAVILDEASQMNLPQALLATSWLREDGQLIVVGDHRQMSPILAHAWDSEDRLNAVERQPYRSVFQYLLDQQFPRVALDESFRLHEAQAYFLQENIYRHDGINFHSRRKSLLADCTDATMHPYLRAVLNPQYPVIVVQHAERASQQVNPTEANLIEPALEACFERLGLDGNEGVGVVVPHRAQRALLRARFPKLAEADAVDTVERYQGDEREVIIVSATASDPDYVLAEAEFLLNPNRLNVALSRPRKKLIVVASEVVFNFLSAELEIFEQAALWKRLLSKDCADELLWAGEFAGTAVKVFGRRTSAED